MNGHLDDDFTIRDFLRDLIGALSAGAFVWSVSVWAPQLAALAHGQQQVAALSQGQQP